MSRYRVIELWQETSARSWGIERSGADRIIYLLPWRGTKKAAETEAAGLNSLIIPRTNQPGISAPDIDAISVCFESLSTRVPKDQERW